MSDRPKFQRAAAIAVAKELCDALKPYTSRLIVAGSLRRRKAEVGDVEILYIPTFREIPTPSEDFFAPALKHQRNNADALINTLIITRILRERENVRGSTTWGEKNKLALHIASGIPVDLFATCEESWFNYLVCRTGPAASNIAIASAAQATGWRWNPYGRGFSRPSGNGVEEHHVTSERKVFEFVGLPFLDPWLRV